MKPEFAIGIDLGGTHLRVALVDATGGVRARRVEPTASQQGPESVVQRIRDHIAGLLKEMHTDTDDLAGVGVGTPGPLDRAKGRIVRAGNLPGWEDVPLRALLQEHTGLRAVIANDGDAAVLGEDWVGAGRGASHVVMVTLGTGVGGGVIIDDRLLHGHFGSAGEIGHMILVPDGLPCTCGQRGCLEQYSSAAAVARRVATAIQTGERSSLATPEPRASACAGSQSATQLVDSNQPPTIDAESVATAAQDGDALCRRIWDEACAYLAIACINLQHTLNPERIILGGGMSLAGAFLLDRVKQHVTDRRWSLRRDDPTILLAELGDNAGVIGAARLVLDAGSAFPRLPRER